MENNKVFMVEYGIICEFFATEREAELYCAERGIYAPDTIYPVDPCEL